MRKKNTKKNITQKKAPIGLKSYHFSRQIAYKYSIFRKSGRFPTLLFLKLFNTRGVNKITYVYVTKLINNYFKSYFKLYYYMPLYIKGKTILQNLLKRLSITSGKSGGFMLPQQLHTLRLLKTKNPGQILLSWQNITPEKDSGFKPLMQIQTSRFLKMKSSGKDLIAGQSITSGKSSGLKSPQQLPTKTIPEIKGPGYVSRHKPQQTDKKSLKQELQKGQSISPRQGSRFKPRQQMYGGDYYRKKKYGGVYFKVINQLLQMINHMHRINKSHYYSKESKTGILINKIISRNIRLMQNTISGRKNPLPLYRIMMPEIHFINRIKHTRELLQKNIPGFHLFQRINNKFLNPNIFQHTGSIPALLSFKKENYYTEVFNPPPLLKDTYKTMGEDIFYHKKLKISREVENLKKIITETKEVITEKTISASTPIEAEIKKYLDIKMLSEQVYQNIEQKIKIERERRGL